MKSGMKRRKGMIGSRNPEQKKSKWRVFFFSSKTVKKFFGNSFLMSRKSSNNAFNLCIRLILELWIERVWIRKRVSSYFLLGTEMFDRLEIESWIIFLNLECIDMRKLFIVWICYIIQGGEGSCAAIDFMRAHSIFRFHCNFSRCRCDSFANPCLCFLTAIIEGGVKSLDR